MSLNQVESILDDILNWIINMVNFINNWFMTLWDTLIAYLTQIIDWFVLWFKGVFDALIGYISDLMTKLYQFFADVFDAIATKLLEIWTLISDATIKVLDTISTYVTDLFSSIGAVIATLVDNVGAFISNLVSSFESFVDSVLTKVMNLISTITTSIEGYVSDALNTVETLWDEIVERVKQSFDAMLGGAGSLIDAISTRLGDLPSAFADAAIEVLKGLTDVADEYIEPIRKKIEEIVDGFVGDVDPKETAHFINQIQKVSTGEATASDVHGLLNEGWMRGVPEKGFWAELFFTIIGVLGGVLMIGQMSGISAQLTIQEFVKLYPYQIFPPGDATTAWRKDLLTKPQAIEHIRRAGWSEENADIILHLSDVAPAEQDLMVLYHRGLIDDSQLKDAFHLRGYSPQWQNALKEASFLIPPVADLITMAVREAFSPDVAARFGQYEDFPEPFAKWVKKQGLTQDWAERYWAAHWALPSPQQGFEMLHRGVIGQEDLNLLLRALDVMPFWRDRLTQIAFRPYSRVDVRRMHKVGVLDDAAVLQSYLDLGYAPDKAEKMKDFTVLYNEPKSADEPEELGKLSRASVINFYSDGLLSKEKAQDLLIGMGYSPQGAALYLEYSYLLNERQERKDETSLVLDLAKADIITYDEAQDRLSALDLSTVEIQRALTVLARHQAKKTRLPSKADAEKMVLAKLISVDDYRKLLSTLGYHKKWVDSYVSLLGGKFLASTKST